MIFINISEMSEADQALVREACRQNWEDIDPTRAEGVECRMVLEDLAYRRRMAEDMREDDRESADWNANEYND